MSLCRTCSKPAGTASTGRAFAYCKACEAAAAACPVCAKNKVHGGRRCCYGCSAQKTAQACPVCQKVVSREAWKEGTPCPACWLRDKRAADVADMVDALMENIGKVELDNN